MKMTVDFLCQWKTPHISGMKHLWNIDFTLNFLSNPKIRKGTEPTVQTGMLNCSINLSKAEEKHKEAELEADRRSWSRQARELVVRVRSDKGWRLRPGDTCRVGKVEEMMYCLLMSGRAGAATLSLDHPADKVS